MYSDDALDSYSRNLVGKRKDIIVILSCVGNLRAINVDSGCRGKLNKGQNSESQNDRLFFGEEQRTEEGNSQANSSTDKSYFSLAH